MTRGQARSGASYLHGLLLWPCAHPALAAGIAIVLAALAIASITRIRPDSSVEAMFAQDEPSAAALGHVLNDFPAADQLLVLATIPGNAPGPNPQQLLGFGRRFVETIHQLPDVEALTDGVLYRADEESRAFVEKVIAPAAMFYLDEQALEASRRRLTPEEIHSQIAQDKVLLATPGPAAAAMAKMVAQDPLRLHEFIIDRLARQRPFHTYQNGDAFISPDGRSLLVRVLGRKPPNDLEFCRKLTEGTARAAAMANTDGLKVQYAGAYAIATQSERSIRRDMIVSVVGSVLLLQLLFVIAYRSPFMLFALAFGPVALGIVLGFGVYSIFSHTVTPITAVLGAVLAGMGIDYSIQYISFYESRRSAGGSTGDAARDVALQMSPAVLAAWATSVVGFVAIGWSHVKALRDFAILGTLGLTGAFICAVTILPAVLMLTDGRTEPQNRIRFGAAAGVSWLGNRHRLWIVLSLLLFTFAAILIARGGQLLPFESDLTVMHPRPNPAIEAQEALANRFGMSPDSLTVYLHADSPEKLLALAYEVEDRLKNSSSNLAGTYGLATLLPDPRLVPARHRAISLAEAQRVVNDFYAALEKNGFTARPFDGYAEFLRTLLTNKAAPGVAELVAYKRMAETVLPASAFVGRPPTEAITLVFMSNASDRDREALDATIDRVQNALGGLEGATVTGLSVAGRDAERTVRRELPRLVVAAVALVALYLAIHFRNPGDALLALVPAAFGMVVAAAVLRLAGQKLNMVNLVAVPLLVGIDVDYGIFLVNLAQLKRVRTKTAAELARQIDPAAHAVIVCAVATMLGYVSLLWTSIPAEQSLGIAAAVGIGACLAGVLFLLLPLLFSLSRRA